MVLEFGFTGEEIVRSLLREVRGDTSVPTVFWRIGIFGDVGSDYGINTLARID